MTMASDDLKTQAASLHDGVLLTVDMRWEDGVVTVGVRTAQGLRRLVVHGVTRLVCPREYPWGRSVCINEVRVVELAGTCSTSGCQVEVEMQSGDILLICGTAFAVDGVTGGEGA